MWMRIAVGLLLALAWIDLALLVRLGLRERGRHVALVLALAPLTALALGAWYGITPPDETPRMSGSRPPLAGFLLPMSVPVTAFFLGFAYLLSSFLGAASGTRRLFAWHTAVAVALGVAGILGLLALERGMG